MPALSLSKLVDLALGTPEVGAVNFNILHSLLHAMIQHLKISDVTADVSENDRDFLSGPDKLLLFNSLSADSGKDESSDEKSDLRKSRPPYHQLESKVTRLAEQLDHLNALPSTDELFQKIKATGDRPTPMQDLWQSMQISKRVGANEEGVGKLMKMVEDLMREMSELKDGYKRMDDLEVQMKLLKDENNKLQKRIDDLGMDDLKKKLTDLGSFMKDLNDKFAQLPDVSHVPSAEEFAAFVTWPGLEDALNGVKSDLAELERKQHDGITKITDQQPQQQQVTHVGLQQRPPSATIPSQTDVRSRPNSSRPSTRLSSASSGPSDQILDLLERLGKITGEHVELTKRVDVLEDEMKNKVDKDLLQKTLDGLNLDLLENLTSQLEQIKTDVANLQKVMQQNREQVKPLGVVFDPRSGLHSFHDFAIPLRKGSAMLPPLSNSSNTRTAPVRQSSKQTDVEPRTNKAESKPIGRPEKPCDSTVDHAHVSRICPVATEKPCDSTVDHAHVSRICPVATEKPCDSTVDHAPVSRICPVSTENPQVTSYKHTETTGKNKDTSESDKGAIKKNNASKKQIGAYQKQLGLTQTQISSTGKQTDSAENKTNSDSAEQQMDKAEQQMVAEDRTMDSSQKHIVYREKGLDWEGQYLDASAASSSTSERILGETPMDVQISQFIQPASKRSAIMCMAEDIDVLSKRVVSMEDQMKLLHGVIMREGSDYTGDDFFHRSSGLTSPDIDLQSFSGFDSGVSQLSDQSKAGVKRKERKPREKPPVDIHNSQDILAICEWQDSMEGTLKRSSDEILLTNNRLLKLGNVLNSELRGLKEKLFYMDNDFDNMAKGIKLAVMKAQKSGASKMDVEALMRAQQAIHRLREDVDNLQITTQDILSESETKTKQIESLFQYCDKIQDVKADKEYVAMEVDVKADKRHLEGKVNHSLFESTTDDINRLIKEIQDKLNGNEFDWQDAIAKLSSELEAKLDRMELNSLKEWLESRLKALNQKIKQSGRYEEDDAAGLRKQLLQRFHCISCDRPVDILGNGPVPSIPNNGLPPSRSPRPYTTYELDQIRQHAKSLQNGGALLSSYPYMIRQQKDHVTGKNQANFERAMSQRENARLRKTDLRKFLVQQYQSGDVEEISGQDGTDFYMADRPCGGSHTLTYPHKRINKTSHLGNLFPQEPVVPSPAPVAFKHNSELDILGVDGHIYKGRVDKQDPSRRHPMVPNYAQMDRSPTMSSHIPMRPSTSAGVNKPPTTPIPPNGRPRPTSAVARPSSGGSMARISSTRLTMRPQSARASSHGGSATSSPPPEEPREFLQAEREVEGEEETEAVEIPVDTPQDDMEQSANLEEF